MENLFALILLLMPFLAIYLFINKRKLVKKYTEELKKTTSMLKDATIKAEQLENENLGLKKQNEILSKYSDIVDVEKEIFRLKEEADLYKSKKYNEANELLAKNQEDALQIIEQAKKEAMEIAGSALDAKEKAIHYEKTVKALKNIIDGYGDEYIIPSHTLLDDLAQEYEYKEAGVELKKARDKTRELLKSKKAADCDYVEVNRKNVAINFVVDAFSGKVDTVLAKVKHDNYGKLKQEIEDAFALVNQHGQAFKNARITKEYLNSRLNELKWAAIAHELKLKEREEQKEIQQAMREEEKARREYEQAIKEAQKEEKMLQKAMEDAKKHLLIANDEEKNKLEEQLKQLEERLAIAEEKNIRALSMAQQTRQGHVYIISNIGSFGENVYKIGMTRRLEPLDRVKELGDASVPFSFDVHAMIHSDDAPALEKKLHNKFNDNRLNKINLKKEFFDVNILDIKEILQNENAEVKWTMKAEAKEYRETLAMNNILKD